MNLIAVQANPVFVFLLSQIFKQHFFELFVDSLDLAVDQSAGHNSLVKAFVQHLLLEFVLFLGEDMLVVGWIRLVVNFLHEVLQEYIVPQIH